MQRQSLGSPLSKLKDDVTLSKPTSSTPENDDVELKPAKPRRLSFSNTSFPHNLIHLIPLLTLFCFLILYANSHIPSPSDMAHFHGFKRTSLTNDVTEIDDVSKLTEVRRAEIVGIGSMRSLREIIVADKPKPRLVSRKLADF